MLFEQYLIESNFFNLTWKERSFVKRKLIEIRNIVVDNKLSTFKTKIIFRKKEISLYVEKLKTELAIAHVNNKIVVISRCSLINDFEETFKSLTHELEHIFDITLTTEKQEKEKIKNPYFPYSKEFIEIKKEFLKKYNNDVEKLDYDPFYTNEKNKDRVEFNAIGAEISLYLNSLYKKDREIKEDILQYFRKGKFPLKYLNPFRDNISIWKSNPYLMKLLRNRIISLVLSWRGIPKNDLLLPR